MSGESQEAAIARLDERMDGVFRQVTQMANALQTLTDSVNALMVENSRISTVEIQVSALVKSQDAMWAELRRIEEKADAHRQQSAQRGRSDLFELLKLIFGAGLGFVATIIFQWKK